MNQFFVWDLGIDYHWDILKALAHGPFLQFRIENWHEREYILFNCHFVPCFHDHDPRKRKFLRLAKDGFAMYFDPLECQIYNYLFPVMVEIINNAVILYLFKELEHVEN